MSSPAAALLLDPKSFKKQSSAKSSPQPRPALNHEVDSEREGFSPKHNIERIRRPDSKRNFHQVVHEGGHSRMIEDVYGVARREHQPLKRTRIEIDKGSQSMPNLTSLPKTSLGEYMKDKAPNNNPTPTIDLTSDKEDDHDDEVVFIANRDLGAEEVCYGKLEGATVNVHQVPIPPRTIFKDMTHDWPSIKCELIRRPSHDLRIEIKDSADKVFGLLDPQTSAALAPILDSSIKFRAQARLDVRRRQPNEWPGQPCHGTYRVSINLYGPRKMAQSTGKFLGQKNVWLGIPNTVDAGISVCNPHAAERRPVVTAPPPQQEIRTVEEINSAVTKMFNQLTTEDVPEMEPPDLVKTPLLPHQKQALWYMTDKEKPRRIGLEEKDNNSLWTLKYTPNGLRSYQEIITGMTYTEEPPQVYGGLLADMMGLGKTLSILSLVCSSLPQAAEWAQAQYDPHIHNVKTTLLVSPLSAVGNWMSQIKEHLQEGALSCYLFHGGSRTEDAAELAKYDLVITTYSTILSDLSGKSLKRQGKASPLAQLNFFRIVLDEAHAIREQAAAQTRAIFTLNAQRRWSVTGTPIQNRLEDLASVAKFLRLFPYDEKGQFATHIIFPFKTESSKAIPTLRVFINSFMLRRVKDRVDLPPRNDHTVYLTFTEREKALHEFFKNESNSMMNVIAGQTRQKIKGNMYHMVLKAMMILRQVSAHGKELLDQEDRDRFKGLTASDAIDLEEFEINTTDATERKAYEMFSLMKESSADACMTCGNPIQLQLGDENQQVAYMLPCYDLLCADCFSGFQPAFDGNAGTDVQLRCAFCKNVIMPTYTAITPAGYEKYQTKQSASKQRKQAKVLGQYEGPHTKTRALVAALLDSAEESRRNPDQPPIKSVIFSSWTSHLDLIEIAFQDNGITGFTRLDGSMALKNRNAALDTFRDDNNITILLATLGAGGVGLNLTSASKVYVMEPQYNPAAVAQAIDRVHRLGQTREVTTVQYIMKDSIEEKISELAKKKQQLANISLTRTKLDKKEVMEERMREYRSLFK